MTQYPCSNHAMPKHQRDRGADAWPKCVNQVLAPGYNGQIQTQLQLAGLVGAPNASPSSVGRLDGRHFYKSRGY
jgi:hypothetical protein